MQEDEIREILYLVRKIAERGEVKPDEKEKILHLNRLLSAKGSVSVRINQAAYDEAKKVCDVTGVSMNSYVSAATALRTYEDLKTPDIKKATEK